MSKNVFYYSLSSITVLMYMYINVYSVQIYKYKSKMTIVAFKLFHKETFLHDKLQMNE